MANMTLTKTPMPEQEPQVRAHNFKEVALGYTAEMAMEEAGRCLNCKKPKCVEGCPVNVRIPEFIAKVHEGDFKAAYEIITSTNALPALSGRVCPQESQCESKCVRGIKGESGRHRPSGAVRCRLVPGERQRHAREARLQRHQGGRGRFRPCRSDLRRRPGQEGLSRSPFSRRCTPPAACWSTASPSSVCPRPSWPTRSGSWRPRASRS